MSNSEWHIVYRCNECRLSASRNAIVLAWHIREKIECYCLLFDTLHTSERTWNSKSFSVFQRFSVHRNRFTWWSSTSREFTSKPPVERIAEPYRLVHLLQSSRMVFFSCSTGHILIRPIVAENFNCKGPRKWPTSRRLVRNDRRRVAGMFIFDWSGICYIITELRSDYWQRVRWPRIIHTGVTHVSAASRFRLPSMGRANHRSFVDVHRSSFVRITENLNIS